MKVTGKLVKVLGEQRGTTQKGSEWVKRDFVIDTQAKYNPEICFTLFGEEKVSMLTQSIGDELEVSYNLSSREYKGKYYSQAQAWKIESVKTEEHLEFSNKPKVYSDNFYPSQDDYSDLEQPF